jgi:hypothetical protein
MNDDVIIVPAEDRLVVVVDESFTIIVSAELRIIKVQPCC